MYVILIVVHVHFVSMLFLLQISVNQYIPLGIIWQKLAGPLEECEYLMFLILLDMLDIEIKSVYMYISTL